MAKKNKKADLPTEETFEVGGQEYTIPSQVALDAANLMTSTWVDLGQPDTIFSKSGKKLMEILISLWQDIMPGESQQWMQERKKYQDHELDASEQIRKKTGRSLVSYPRFIYEMVKALFPNEKQDSEYFRKLAKEFPMFRFTNKV